MLGSIRRQVYFYNLMRPVIVRHRQDFYVKFCNKVLPIDYDRGFKIIVTDCRGLLPSVLHILPAAYIRSIPDHLRQHIQQRQLFRRQIRVADDLSGHIAVDVNRIGLALIGHSGHRDAAGGLEHRFVDILQGGFEPLTVVLTILRLLDPVSRRMDALSAHCESSCASLRLNRHRPLIGPLDCGNEPNLDSPLLRRPLRGGVLRACGHRLRALRALRLPASGGRGGGVFRLPARLFLRRPACRGVDPSGGPDLSASQDAAHHGAARELPGSGGWVEDGPPVRGGEQGIARPVHGVLQGPFDHALHHFLLALVHHGLHPGLPGALPASQLVRQGLDAASDFHGGVHQAVSNGVQRRLCPHGVLVLRRLVGFAGQRCGHFLLRLQLDHVAHGVLVAAAHHLGKGGPILGILRHGADGPLHRCRHTGADSLRRRTGEPCRGLRGRAPAAGQQGKDRLGQGGHCAGAQVLKDLGGLSAPRRVGRVMLFNGFLLLPDIRRPPVEKPLVGKGA